MSGKDYGQSILIGTVNHATNNKTAKIMVSPYKVGTVNHSTENKMAKITGTIFVGHVQWAPSTIQMKTD